MGKRYNLMKIDFSKIVTIPKDFYWLNEPTYRLAQGLMITTKPETDFWQRTHYGFQRDDGHCLLTHIDGDFTIETHTQFNPVSQYDQCGLMIRLDRENWIKCSVEYEDAMHSRLGSVVTNEGFSDWATQDMPSSTKAMHYLIERKGNDFLIRYALNHHEWHQMRIAHLRRCQKTLKIGIYACCPVGKGFDCQFNDIKITQKT
jgi:regulation of enolase protein 1 (concanavalin A-like superfamily)